jgi:ABC transporter substrate binding protein (PQQ-dependent alcohol dehydrogenase system)
VHDLKRKFSLFATAVTALVLAASSHRAAVFAQEPAPAAAPAPGTEPTAPAAPAAAPAKGATLTIPILYLKQQRDINPPLSLLDLAPADDGVAGAKLAIADNNTTGQFLNQSFKLDVFESASVDDLIKAANDAISAGTGFFLADMAPADLLKLSDALAGKPAVIINVGSPDDTLREENCRANLLHTPPTRTMLADAVGQYFAFKQWRNWFLMFGPTPEDKALAEAFRRAAKRFGGKIVDEREFKYESGSRRADGGFEQVQQQISEFTQKAKDHDVVVVADEGQLFADYVPYRTWIPRPVAGSAGMSATSWHPALELWGGTQFQNRFKRLNNRNMRPLDYDAWIGVRVVGEAAARTSSGDYKVLSDYIHSPKFEVAAFKGVKTTFRDWNGQLRQPIILTTPKLLVSVSPQPGFLHQFTELDTLGIDKPETKCKAYAK